MEHNRRILIAPRIRLDKLCSVNMQWHDHMPSSPGEHVQQVGSFERRIFRIYNRENSVTDEILEQLLSAAPGQQTLNKRWTGLVWEQQRTRPHHDGHRRFPRRISVVVVLLQTSAKGYLFRVQNLVSRHRKTNTSTDSLFSVCPGEQEQK